MDGKRAGVVLGVAALALAGVMVAVATGSVAGADQAIIPSMHLEPDEHASLRERVLALVTPAEQRAVVDGEVSGTEVMAAARAALKCIRARAGEAGGGGAAVETTGPAWSPDRFEVDFTVGFRAPTAGRVPSVDLSPAIRACQAEHFDHVLLLYQLDRLADRDFVAETGEAFVACLREAGEDVPSDIEGARRAVADIIFGGNRDEGVTTCLGRFPSVTFAAGASVYSAEHAGA